MSDDGRSIAEVARELGCSPSTAKRLQRSAFAKIRAAHQRPASDGGQVVTLTLDEIMLLVGPGAFGR